MKFRALFAFLLALATAALAPTGWSQGTPSYRPPTAAAASSQSGSSAAASAQCAGGTAPAGATLVGQGKGNVPAPRGTQPSYSQTTLNLSNYAVGGLLTIQVTAGSGSSPTTFELFPAGTTFSSNGTPSTQPLASAANIAPGGCATLTLNFSRAGSFILAATGASGSNTFQYAANVQPSFTGVFSTPTTQTPSPVPSASSQPAQPPNSGSPTQPANPGGSQTAPPQAPSLFNGVFNPPPNQLPAAQPTPSAQSASSQSAVSPQGQAPSAAQSSASPATLAKGTPLQPGQSTVVAAGPSQRVVTPGPLQPTSPTSPTPQVSNTPQLVNQNCVPAAPQVASGSGAITALPHGTYNYQQTAINLGQYASGILVITVKLGNGVTAGSFDLFDGPSHPATIGADKGLGGGPIIPGVYDRPPGSTSTITYTFNASSNHQLIFGVDGSWLSRAGSQNTYSFTAVVENPTWAGTPPGVPTCPPPPAPPVSSYLLTSVTVKNSPGVPDTGGHSILMGLLQFHPNLTAVEPNLQICLTPTGTTGGSRTCTDVCAPGHDCTSHLRVGVRIDSSWPSVKVEVQDDDKEGKIQTLAVFDQTDATACSADQPCTWQVPDPTASDPGGTLMSIYFGFGACNVPGIGPGSDSPAPQSAPSHWTTTTPRKGRGSVTFDGGGILVQNADPVSMDTITVQGPWTLSGVPWSGITVTVNDPNHLNVQFVQFLYRERVGANGIDIRGPVYKYSKDISYANSDGVQLTNPGPGYLSLQNDNLGHNPATCPSGQNCWWDSEKNQTPAGKQTKLDCPGTGCYELETNPRDPTWILDGHNTSSPTYSDSDVILDGPKPGDTTAFDSPSFLLGHGPETWRFAAEDFVIVNQRVAWLVKWVEEQLPNTSGLHPTLTAKVFPACSLPNDFLENSLKSLAQKHNQQFKNDQVTLVDDEGLPLLK